MKNYKCQHCKKEKPATEFYVIGVKRQTIYDRFERLSDSGFKLYGASYIGHAASIPKSEVNEWSDQRFDDFIRPYEPESKRASPYCIACNTEAARMNTYRREARKDPKAFAWKLRLKETQLDQMVKALSEVSV